MSPRAWTQLQSSFPTASCPAPDPLLAHGDSSALCQQCLMTHIQGLVKEDAKGAQCDTILALLNATEGAELQEGFYVSKPWLM